jgi:hypothetical protein
MFLRKIFWAFVLLLFLGGTTVEMGCSRKSTLQKKTMAYKKKMRKGKSVPCPCNE